MKKQLQTKNLFPWILATGLLTGSIDILFAFLINYKVPPARILRFIAGGLFGREASAGGKDMVIYGLLFHFCFAFFWTAVFLILYPRLIKIFRSKPVLMVATGLIIWIFMTGVVLPLSRIPAQHLHVLNATENILALILAYGIPFTLVGKRYYDAES